MVAVSIALNRGLLLLASCAAAAGRGAGATIATSQQPVTLEAGESALTLRNGYVSATFDLLCPRLSSLIADARGNGSYGANVLVPRTGVRLEMQPFDPRGCMAEEGQLGATPLLPCPYANSPARSSSQHGCRSTALEYSVAVNT